MKLDLKKIKKVVILGLGQIPDGSGMGATKFWLKQGAQVLVTDLKTEKQLSQQVKNLKQFQRENKKGKLSFILGQHRKQDIERADLLMRNPAVRSDSPYLKLAGKLRIPIETDVSLFFRLCSYPIIGITGTRGKSTTTDLLGKMLKSHYSETFIAGNIQTSPLLLLPKLTHQTKHIVLELSSWMLNSLKRLKASPTYAVITNIYPDHLNTYPSFKAYQKDKQLIFQYQKANNFLILNHDNQLVRSFAAKAKSKIYWFSQRKLVKRNGSFLDQGRIYFQLKKRKEFVINQQDLKLPGSHNLENILAAVCLARLLKVPAIKIRQVLKKYQGLKSRLELIRELKGIKFYNDTCSTMPEATIAALKTLAKGEKRKIILIAGGQDKKLNYNQLNKVIERLVKVLVLLPGTASQKIRIKKVPVILVRNMEQAVKKAVTQAETGDTVILSPGATSFNLFRNEFDRGEQFNKWVTLVAVGFLRGQVRTPNTHHS